MGWLKDIAPLLIALGGLGGLAAVLLVPAQIRKYRSEGNLSDADAASKISAASVAMLEPAQNEMKRLEERLKKQNVRADQLKLKADELQSKLDSTTAELQTLRNVVSAMSKELAELKGGQK